MHDQLSLVVVSRKNTLFLARTHSIHIGPKR